MTNPEISHYSAPAAPPRHNVLAIVSLASAFFIPWAAIVTGHLALKQLATSNEEGHGMAKAGLILGYILAGLQLLFFVVWLFLFFGIAGGIPFRT